MSKRAYDIGEASRLSGCSASTIRYYEDKGLLQGVLRTEAGRRQYDADSIGQIRFLRSLRLAGMSLADINAFNKLRRKESGNCGSLASFASNKAKAIRAQISALRIAEARLSQFANACSLECSETNPAACKVTAHLVQA